MLFRSSLSVPPLPIPSLNPRRLVTFSTALEEGVLKCQGQLVDVLQEDTAHWEGADAVPGASPER